MQKWKSVEKQLILWENQLLFEWIVSWTQKNEHIINIYLIIKTSSRLKNALPQLKFIESSINKRTNQLWNIFEQELHLWNNAIAWKCMGTTDSQPLAFPWNVKQKKRKSNQLTHAGNLVPCFFCLYSISLHWNCPSNTNACEREKQHNVLQH